jgi:hypothetical protein
MLIKVRLRGCSSSIISQAEGFGMRVGKTNPSFILTKVNIRAVLVFVAEVVVVVMLFVS